MRVRIAIAVLGLVFFLRAAPVQAQTRLTGAIRDSGGGAIEGARVFIHWDSSGSRVGLNTNVGIKQDVVLTTNADGSFSTELPPGFYDVFVSAMAFSPDCRKIRLNGAQTVTLNVKLNVSPLVVKELGDTFK